MPVRGSGAHGKEKKGVGGKRKKERGDEKALNVERIRDAIRPFRMEKRRTQKAGKRE